MNRWKEIKKLVELPVRTDRFGAYIYDAKGNVIFMTRGYGYFKVVAGKDRAHELQKEMAQYIVKCINASTTVGIVIKDLEHLLKETPKPYHKAILELINKLKTL